MIDLWNANYCNLQVGVFSGNCEQVENAGKNKPTMCPKNKYWVGVQRGGNNGLDQMKMKCCEYEFHVPQDIPEDFQNFGGAADTYSFKAKKYDRYLRAENFWADFKAEGHNHLMQFKVESTAEDDRKLYVIKNYEGKTLSCKSHEMFRDRVDAGLHGQNNGEKIQMREWQFFEKDDGYVIYNPYNLKFLGLRDDKDADCVESDFSKA